MPRVYESAVINAPIGDVWKVTRDYNALPRWNPAIGGSELEGGEGVGCVRHITFRDGGRAAERLLGLSDDEHSVTYEFLDSPLAVANYKATLRFTEITVSGETFAEWSGFYDDTNLARRKESAAVLRQVFRGGLMRLQEIMRDRKR